MSAAGVVEGLLKPLKALDFDPRGTNYKSTFTIYGRLSYADYGGAAAVLLLVKGFDLTILTSSSIEATAPTAPISKNPSQNE